MSESHELHVRRTNDCILISNSENSKILGPIIDYAYEPLLPLIDSCVPLVNIVDNILTYVTFALKSTSDEPLDGLTRDESASIRLYTMEWIDEQKSLYSILNHTLRTADREHLQPWYKYLKLFLTALVKIPCTSNQIVWRGVQKNISNAFPCGTQVIWWAFSSCTATLAVLENDLYLGKNGERTLFSIEILNGRNIRAHSHFNDEDEYLLLPGTFMEVRSQLNPASDLHIIHLKQKISEEVLLEPPFEDALLYPKTNTRVKSSCEILEQATLVARFTFDNATTPFLDSGPNLTPANAFSYSLVPGPKSSTAISFSGSNRSYFQAVGFTTLSLSNHEFSIAMWIKPQSQSGTIIHISTASNGTGAGCMPFMGLATNELLVVQIPISKSVSLLSSPITLNVWSHIVQTWSPASGLRLYVNNVMVSSLPTANLFLPYSQSPVYVTLGNGLPASVSCRQGILNSTIPFTGAIDDFRVYNRELTASDICAIYSSS
ncbi:unnamed protein product [Rotaria sordida]|uniref:NAD(P)(+)--arginine ADP-ribosyltransferase n=1 Tax=Rotaria sordida TaxID=392033 RepID=A0A814BVQ8_9BILA|nr:unnamed protein product [Rotaria sordida]CAF3816933.1 unnamed protein product [Rotaria sordida]